MLHSIYESQLFGGGNVTEKLPICNHKKWYIAKSGLLSIELLSEAHFHTQRLFSSLNTIRGTRIVFEDENAVKPWWDGSLAAMVGVIFLIIDQIIEVKIHWPSLKTI